MKLKNKLAGLLSLSLLLGVLTVSSSAIDRENDVEFVIEMVTRTPGSEYAWNTDGGRETKIVSNKVRERVWGWSTCYDKYEKEARHYTHSRYEHFLSGGSCDEWSSGKCGELERCGHIVRILATMQQVSYRRECIMDCKL